MRIKLTGDPQGLALWPDIPLKFDRETWFDPECRVRGESATIQGLELLFEGDYDKTVRFLNDAFAHNGGDPAKAIAVLDVQLVKFGEQG